MSFLWGAEVSKDAERKFDFCGMEMLMVDTLSLLQGREAVVKIIAEDDQDKAMKVARLTSACPNFSVSIPISENVRFVLETDDKDAKVSITGHTSIPSHYFQRVGSDEDSDEEEISGFTCVCEGPPQLMEEGTEGKSEPEESKPADKKESKPADKKGSKLADKPVEVESDDETTAEAVEAPEEQPSEQAPMEESGEKVSESQPTADAAKAPSAVPEKKGKKRKSTESDSTPQTPETLARDTSAEKTPATAEKTPAKEGGPEKKKQKKKDTAKETKEGAKKETGIKRKVLQSGVYYDVKKVGKPNAGRTSKGKTVNIQYAGFLAKNGQKFDGGSIKFILGAGEVVPGMDSGCNDMLVGEQRRVFIPARMGYGKQRVGPIPPNSDLIFDVTLLSVN